MPQKTHESTMDNNWPLCDYLEALEESEQVLRICFKDYRIEEVFLSFNGGKDCTVLLDIALHVLRRTFPQENIEKELKIYCIRTNNPFSDLDEFLNQVESHYGVKLIFIQGDLKTSLEKILKEDTILKACLMGTRRTDPFCEKLKFFQETDPSWPHLMRVSPLLNWSYHQIWSYIHQKQVPYCSLYSQGYTSIGSTLNTWPNPSLAYTDTSGTVTYYPAWQLTDGSLERAGRGNKPNPVNGNVNRNFNRHAEPNAGEVNGKDGGDVNV